MQSIKLCRQDIAASMAAGAAALALLMLPAPASAAVYPPGGGAFSGNAEGWQATEESCNVSALSTCEASGEYDGSSGNPAGALLAKTSVQLSLAGVFESTVVFESPDFTVAEGGPAVLRLERQFAASGLLALSPEATYAASLIDRGGGAPTEVLAETLDEGDGSFAGREGVAPALAGHTYAIVIETKATSASAPGLLSGETDVPFDNVALTVQTAGGGEGGGGAGGGPGGSVGSPNTLDSTELQTWIRRGDASTARLLGKHVFVRLRCPTRAGGACKITAQGRIKKRVRVTRRRTVRIAAGHSRLVALRVKRNFHNKIARRARLLVVQRVRVGDVAITFARSRALIRRR